MTAPLRSDKINMKISVKAISDVGSVRENNEDMALVGAVTLRDKATGGDVSTEKPVVMAVADGVGGAEGGEIASELVVNALLDFAADIEASLPAETIAERLRSWGETTNRLLLMRIAALGNAGMGTTLSGLLFSEENVLLFNAGDSRVYRLRDGILRQMSRDHSMRELTGRDDVPGNIMYNAFGKQKEFFMDVKDLTGQVLPDDLFLICSDGLSDMLTDEEIESILEDGNGVEALVARAKEAGGKDNITVILIRII